VKESKSLPDHLGGGTPRCWRDSGALAFMQKSHQIKSMIDVGCGLGAQVMRAKSLGIEAIGIDGDHTIDYRETLIEYKDRYGDYDPITGKGGYHPADQSELMKDIKDTFILHDFTMGKCEELSSRHFDLGWCVEFLEHVEEKYISNYMDILKRCKYVICTHALPEKGGHHHVNCQTEDYWIQKFKEFGMSFDPDITRRVKRCSTMAKKHFTHKTMPGLSFLDLTGKVFKS